MKLSVDDFERAASFVRTHARPLDQRLFDWYFLGGSDADVLRELATYQNADGGFGRSIEPDFRLAMSSPMATTIGFQYLRRLNATAANPLVRNGVRYLLNSFDPALPGWASVPPEVNGVPRAPWWGFDERAAAEPGFRPNPGAEIVGYLYEYALLVPQDRLNQAGDLAVGHLERCADDLEMHDAACYVRMAERLPDPHRSHVLAKLRGVANTVVSREPGEWEGYAVTPLLFAPSPESPLAGCFGDALEQNVDFLAAAQQPDGSWCPTWSWGQYPEVWPAAEREWKGILTVSALKTLQEFGRLPERW